MSTLSIFSSFSVAAIVTILIVVCSNNVTGWYVVDDSKDLMLTYQEKIALDKLKRKVMDRLPEEFMKTDFYLIRWIRMSNLDVGEAHNMLIKNVQWRAKHNMSKILDENWSHMMEDYHVSFGGRDKDGRPFGTIDLGEWDLLGAVLAGRQPLLQRYLDYVTERAAQELFKAQRESSKPITRGVILVDGTGGSMRNLCPACISILFQWILVMEQYYPRFLREIILINAPSVTEVALKALRPAMSQETSDIIHIFTMNRKEWMAYLDTIIDRSQRTPRYGGTKNEHVRF